MKTVHVWDLVTRVSVEPLVYKYFGATFIEHRLNTHHSAVIKDSETVSNVSSIQCYRVLNKDVTLGISTSIHDKITSVSLQFVV